MVPGRALLFFFPGSTTKQQQSNSAEKVLARILYLTRITRGIYTYGIGIVLASLRQTN